MNLSRRNLLFGLGAVIAAPAIVRASSLMPVRAWREPLPSMQAFISSNSTTKPVVIQMLKNGIAFGEIVVPPGATGSFTGHHSAAFAPGDELSWSLTSEGSGVLDGLRLGATIE